MAEKTAVIIDDEPVVVEALAVGDDHLRRGEFVHQPALSGHLGGQIDVVGVEEADPLPPRLGDAGVGTARYYPKPLHKHEHFSRTCRFGAMPVAEKVARGCLSLPVFPEMTDAEVEYVATTTAALLD